MNGEAGGLQLEISIKVERFAAFIGTIQNACFLIFSNTLLKEIGFALQ
tara:strand:- start:1 stop:144 length:144 start_codon:yes stop_codon:yes gene_type:complete